jgi:aryl-alcohol dehydrogenase-like predicted oxidoreductase
MWAFSQDGSSETTIGEWIEERKLRDQVVLATKASIDLVHGTILPPATINSKVLILLPVHKHPAPRQ